MRHVAREPRLAAVIGRGGEAEIAEIPRQVGEIARRGRERLLRVERVVEPPQGGGVGDELRNALRAFRADCGGVEQALAPDQPREEMRVERGVVRRRLDHPAGDGEGARPGLGSRARRRDLPGGKAREQRDRRCRIGGRLWPRRGDLAAKGERGAAKGEGTDQDRAEAGPHGAAPYRPQALRSDEIPRTAPIGQRRA